MMIADVLSHYAPIKAPEILLDITINHVHITPNRNTDFQAFIQDDPLIHPLAEMIITCCPDDISDVPHAHTMAVEKPSQLRMVSSFKVKVLSFLHHKGRRSSKQYMKNT